MRKGKCLFLEVFSTYCNMEDIFSLAVSEVAVSGKTFDSYGNPIFALCKLETMLSTDSSHA